MPSLYRRYRLPGLAIQLVGIGGRIAGVLVLAITLLLGGCDQPALLSGENLTLPASVIPEVSRIEEKSALRVPPDASEPTLAQQALRAQGIVESAYLKYHLAGGGSYKVKFSIFEDAAGRRATWHRKYPAQALAPTQTRDWGEAAFLIPGRLGAFSHGRLNLEVEASGAAKAPEKILAAFAARSAELRH